MSSGLSLLSFRLQWRGPRWHRTSFPHLSTNARNFFKSVMHCQGDEESVARPQRVRMLGVFFNHARSRLTGPTHWLTYRTLGEREAGENPALPRNCEGRQRPQMPLLRREGGSKEEPQARRPAERFLTVCLPWGRWIGWADCFRRASRIQLSA